MRGRKHVRVLALFPNPLQRSKKSMKAKLFGETKGQVSSKSTSNNQQNPTNPTPNAHPTNPNQPKPPTNQSNHHLPPHRGTFSTCPLAQPPKICAVSSRHLGLGEQRAERTFMRDLAEPGPRFRAAAPKFSAFLWKNPSSFSFALGGKKRLPHQVPFKTKTLLTSLGSAEDI